MTDRTCWVRPRYPFFLPVKVLSRVFRGKFLAGLKASTGAESSSAPGRPQRSPRHASSQVSCAPSVGRTGSSTRSPRLVGPNRCFVTSAVIPIESRSPITAFCRSTGSGLPSDGKTTHTAASSENDADRDRVSAPGLPPYPAQRLRTDSPFRLPGQSTPYQPTGFVSDTVVHHTRKGVSSN